MLKAPNWCPDAKPSLRGWHHPHSGEVLVSAKHSKQEVNEWHFSMEPTAIVAPVQTLHEAPSVERTLYSSEVEHHYSERDELRHDGAEE